MPPNAPIVRGRDGVIAFIATHPPTGEFAQVREQLDGSGNMAYEIQTYTWTYTPPGGSPMADTGKVVWVWQKQTDGSWKVLVEIWNSDLPAAAPPQ
jgi:ketosteroid isomerase-like protein